MIRQAHTYLVSAMSGATLIAIAIVVFVLLVSAQVFRDWPIAALGDDEPSISDSRATSSPEQAPTTTTAAKAAAAAPQSTGSQPDNGGGNGGRQTQTGDATSTGGPTATTSPVETGDTGSGGNQGGNDAPSSTPAQSPSSPSQASSSGGGSKSGSTPATTTTGKVTETVNETVNKVDETVTGGALEKAGVTEVTEGVVNGVVGPESPVGKVVDGTVETVTGLLGGNK